MSDKETYTCDPCNFRGEESSGVKYCKTCQEKLCKDCADVHKSSKATRSHFLVNIEGISVNSITGNAVESLQKCLYHPEKLLEFFCTEHNHLICSTCILLDQSRNCKKIIEIASAGEALLKSTFRKKVSSDLQSVKLKLERDTQRIKLQQIATQQTHTDIKGMLSKTRETLFSRFHQLENDILSKVQSDEINEKKKLEILQERINETLERLNDASSVFESANENGSGSDIFRCILLIGNDLEECEARLDMKKSTIGICEHSLNLSAALHLLLNENVNMIERRERHTQFCLSQFPSLQISFNEFLKIISRGNLCTNSDNGIVEGHIENTACDQCFKEHDSNSECHFDPNVARLSGEDQNRTMFDIRNKQHTDEFLLANYMSASHNPVMMNNSAVRPNQPFVNPVFVPYQPPVPPSIKPFLELGMQPYPPYFSLQYHPPPVPTYSQNFYTGNRYVNLNKETPSQHETQRLPQTERVTGHAVNAQNDHSKNDKTEVKNDIPSDEIDRQNFVTERTFIEPCAEHMASSNNADIKQPEISIQHQNRHIKKEINLTKPKRQFIRIQRKKHMKERPEQNTVNISGPNSNAIDSERVESLNISVSVKHSGEIKTATTNVDDFTADIGLESEVNTNDFEIPVHPEEVGNDSNQISIAKTYVEKIELEAKDSEKGVHDDLERECEVTDTENDIQCKAMYTVRKWEKCELTQNMQTTQGREERIDTIKPEENGDNQLHVPQNELLSTEIEHSVALSDKSTSGICECSFNIERVTNDSIDTREPTIQVVSGRNGSLLNGCQLCPRESVKNVLGNLSEPISQIIATENDKGDTSFNKCDECTTEPVEELFIGLDELTSQMPLTDGDKTASGQNESSECEKEQMEKEFMNLSASGSQTFQSELHSNDSVPGKLHDRKRKPTKSESISSHDPIVQTECDENDSDVNLTKPVETGLINIVEPNTQVIQTDGDKEDAVLSKCHEYATEPPDKELINSTEPTDQIIKTNSCTNIIECKILAEEMSNRSENFADINNQTIEIKIENFDNCKGSMLPKDEMAESEKHVKDAIRNINNDIESPESDLLHISKESDTGLNENISDNRQSANISSSSQSKHHQNNKRISIHTKSIQYSQEHKKGAFREDMDVKRSTPHPCIDAEFEIKREHLLDVPWQGKKQFDFISVLAPPTETTIVCDFHNSRIIMLDKQLKPLDTFQFPAKIVNANLLKGLLIATCHKNRGRISLMEYSPTFKTTRVFDTQYLAMCVQSVDDRNLLVSMRDFIGQWHLHIVSNTGQLIKKLRINRTLLDGYNLAVMSSGSSRFGYRIVQCCEKSDTLYCFEKDGKDIFRFNVHSPNCVAVHESGYIFLVDNFDHLHVLSPSGEQLYKTRCCTNVTSVAITKSMDKLLLTRYKDNKITVMSVTSTFHQES